MLRTRIILLAVTVAVVFLIFLLPKSVVENESNVAQTDTVQSTVNTPHRPASESLSSEIATMRGKWAREGRNQKSPIFADSLRSLYTQAGKFDSAAWFAEFAASFFNNTDSYLKAGNSYYEAFTFAVQPEKQRELAV